MRHDSATRMTDGAPWRHILKFAVPIFLGQLFQQLYNVVDSLVVGNFLDENALAAVSSSGSLIFLMIGLFTGVFTGAGVVIARYFGAGDDARLERAVHTTVAFGATAGVVMSLIGVVVSPILLNWMGTPASVLPNSLMYFRIYFCGSVFSILYNTASGIHQAVGDAKYPLLLLVISSVTNIVLDLLFVAVLGMGVDGAALATVISQALAAGMALRHLMVVSGPYRLRMKKICFDGDMLRQILQMGIPSGIQNSIIAIANVIVQSSINFYGEMAMAGCGSYSKIEGFAFLPVTSFAMALSTFVGQNLGAGLPDRAKKGARFGIVSGVIIAEGIGIAFYLLAPALIGLFNGTPQVVAYGVKQARTISLFYFLLSFSHLIAGIMRGAGRAIVPMLVMLLCWCIIRISYIMLIARPSGNIQMVFWAYPLTWSLSSIIFMIYYLFGNWTEYMLKKNAAEQTENTICEE